MEKIKRLLNKNLFIVFSILLYIFIVSACSGVTTPIQVTKTTSLTYADFVQINASIINYYNVRSSDASLYSSPASARSINPQLQAQDYDFYIFGQKKADDFSDAFGPIAIESISGSSGTFSVGIPKGVWYLTLAAYEKGTSKESITCSTVRTTALLTGYALSDSTNSGIPVSFTLSASGLATPGAIKLKINLENWKLSDFPDYKVKAQITNRQTGNPVNGTTINDIDKSQDTYFIFNPKDVSSEDLKINPGKYNFELFFYDAFGHTFSWTDLIYIYPGLLTETEINIPKIMNEKPGIPDSISYVIDEENMESDSDYFQCTFNWEQETATTATYYELKLEDIHSGEEKIYSRNSSEVNIEFISGSLAASSSSIKLWIPLGHEYKVSLRACNDAGTSDWIDCPLPLNYYRVTYSLQGGKTTEDNVFNTELINSTGPFYFYGSNISEKQHQWKNPESNKVKNGTLIFNFWTATPSDTEKYITTGTYSGYQNIELYAKYVPEYSISENAFSYKFGDTSVSEMADPDPLELLEGVYTAQINSSTNALELYFNLDKEEFKNFKANIVNQTDTDDVKLNTALINVTDSGFSKLLDTSTWASGKYDCKITATDINEHLAYFTFTILKP